MALLRRFAFALIIILGARAAGRARPRRAASWSTARRSRLEEIAYYGVELPPGRYWYDGVSGLWGVEGGPSMDQTAAGLPLGGPLQPDASMSDTGVFINGREIHADEVAELLRMFGEVPPGRYWLGADLVGGLEGETASFDLNAAGAAASGEPAGPGPGLFRGQRDGLLRQQRLPLRSARRDRRHEQLRARLRRPVNLRCARRRAGGW